MLKFHFKLLSSSLLVLLPLVLFLQSFLIFHDRLIPKSIFDTHNHASPTILNTKLNAFREEIRHHPQVSVKTLNTELNAFHEEIQHDPRVSVNESSRSKPLSNVPSLEHTPLHMNRQGRIKWFRDSFPSFKVLHSDSISGQFSAKVEVFFEPCKLRFFVTWISQIESFGYRERLSMESVFKWNPSCCLLVISRTMDSAGGEEILRPFRSRGFRVMAAAPDLLYLFKKTPAEEWLRKIRSGHIDPGKVPFAQNLSNILRLAVLYKYGGVYIDTDMILLRSFSGLKNTIGAQNTDPQTGKWNRLNNAVLAFDKRHPLLLKFMKEFALTFDGNKWGHNGPYLVTRVVNSLAKRSRPDFKIMLPIAFYPVDWIRIFSYFMSPSDKEHVQWRSAKIIQLEKETHAIHLWNKESRGLNVEEGSIMHHIFNKNCIFCLSVQGDACG